MVGSEVDQKYLGAFAKSTAILNHPLSAGLYKLLGLSSLLSRKLLRARKQRKLDPTRTTKSLDLYRHIIWMAREGLTVLQAEVLPELRNYSGAKYAFLNELRVLAYKLNASFLHIFVLFDYTYQTKTSMVPNLSNKPTTTTTPTTSSKTATNTPQNGNGNANANGSRNRNVSPALSTYAYIPPTIEAFKRADEVARHLLPGSHPLRLSIKLEFSAFTFDCTKEYEHARRIAKGAIDEAFSSMDAMDDDSFEDAMELVGSLGVMAKRGVSPKASPQPQQSQSQNETGNGCVNCGNGMLSADSAANGGGGGRFI